MQLLWPITTYIQFLLVISMLIQPLRSWELRIWSPKVNFLDFLITSPQHFYKKNVGQGRRVCSLILGVKGLKSQNTQGTGSFFHLRRKRLGAGCVPAARQVVSAHVTSEFSVHLGQYGAPYWFNTVFKFQLTKRNNRGYLDKQNYFNAKCSRV